MKKITFSQTQLESVKSLTNENEHTEARLLVADILCQSFDWISDLKNGYKCILGLHRVFRTMTDGLLETRKELDEKLKKALEMKCENFQEVWDNL